MFYSNSNSSVGRDKNNQFEVLFSGLRENGVFQLRTRVVGMSTTYKNVNSRDEGGRKALEVRREISWSLIQVGEETTR